MRKNNTREDCFSLSFFLLHLRSTRTHRVAGDTPAKNTSHPQTLEWPAQSKRNKKNWRHQTFHDGQKNVFVVYSCRFIFLYFYCCLPTVGPDRFRVFLFAWHCHLCDTHGHRWSLAFSVQRTCLHGIGFTFLVWRDSIKSKRNDVLATKRSIAELVLFNLIEWCVYSMKFDDSRSLWQCKSSHETERETKKDHTLGIFNVNSIQSKARVSRRSRLPSS